MPILRTPELNPQTLNNRPSGWLPETDGFSSYLDGFLPQVLFFKPLSLEAGQ